LKNLCGACSKCSSFSDSDVSKDCVCLNQDTDFTSTAVGGVCIIVPASTLLNARQVESTSGDDCIIVVGSHGSSFDGGKGDDVLITVNLPEDNTNGPLSLIGGDGDDCVVVGGLILNDAAGNNDDDVVFFAYSANVGPKVTYGELPYSNRLQGGAGDDLIIAQNAILSIMAGLGDDVVIVDGPAANVFHIKDEGAGNDFINIADGANVPFYVDAFGGNNTIIIGERAFVKVIGDDHNHDKMDGDDYIYVYGQVQSDIVLGKGADYVYVGSRAIVGGDIYVSDGDTGFDEVVVAGAVGDDVNLGDGDNRITVESSGDIAGSIHGNGGVDVVDVKGAVNGVVSLGDGADRLLVDSDGRVFVAYLGSGDDVAIVKGRAGYIFGNAGDDHILVEDTASVLKLSGDEDDDVLEIKDHAHVGLVYGGDGLDTISVSGHVLGFINAGDGDDYVHISSSGQGQIVADGDDDVRIDNPNFRGVVVGDDCYVANDDILVDCNTVVLTSSSSEPNEVKDSSILSSSFSVRH